MKKILFYRIIILRGAVHVNNEEAYLYVYISVEGRMFVLVQTLSSAMWSINRVVVSKTCSRVVANCLSYVRVWSGGKCCCVCIFSFRIRCICALDVVKR